MTKIIVSARFGSDWTLNELQAFNIIVKYMPFEEFFGQDSLADFLDSSVLDIILNNVQAPDGSLPKAVRLFFDT